MAKITCQICNAEVHSIQLHLAREHQDVNVEDYQEMYPDAPLFSPEAAKKIEERNAAAAESDTVKTSMESAVNVTAIKPGAMKVDLHHRFSLGKVKAAMSARGKPIPITVLPDGHEFSHMIPERDENYVWDIPLLKRALMGLEMNIPVMLWGHAGTGKSTLPEQICHYTNRPFLRVQHTASMIESDLLGMWKVVGGETIFELGALAMAMKYGWTYLADEYDFALPSILSVYQPVLEGKPLFIKEADAANRHITPHPDFRFVATGNTNGSGDESGLYSGTNMQNAANYSRFGITIKVEYMPQNLEKAVLVAQSGITKTDAAEIVRWATEIRESFESGKIGSTVGPRELIYASKVGVITSDLHEGVRLSITNRMSAVDQKVAMELAQRHIGKAA